MPKSKTERRRSYRCKLQMKVEVLGHSLGTIMGTVAHTSLKLLNEKGAKLLILVPGAGLEPARTLPGPRDFKSRVSTNSTIRALTLAF
jgi:hypothetical protein